MKLLLDIDGVIIRDKLLLDHVRYNVVKYVSTKLPSIESPSKLNTRLYNKYGHTAKGLRIEYGIDTSDFDDHVYNKHVLEHLYDFLKSDEFLNDARTLHTFKNKSLFSNAPLKWTTPVSEILKCDTGVYSKPDIHTYLRFPETEHYIFVDDKIGNLVPISVLSNWTPIHFSETIECNYIKTIHSLEQLKSENIYL